MTASRVLDIWRQGASGRLVDVLAEDVVFSSPVRDYAGRPRASHLLGLAGRVLDGVEPTAGWGDRAEWVAAFTGRVQGSEIHGMVRERYDGSGRVTHVTVYLRPYRALRAVIDRMSTLLAEDPEDDLRERGGDTAR